MRPSSTRWYQGQTQPDSPSFRLNKTPFISADCKNCGFYHERNMCPAYGKRCLKCNNVNHFSRKCNIYDVQADENPDQVIYYFNKNCGDWSITLSVNNCEILFKLDTGADVNVLPSRYLQQLGLSKEDLLSTSMKLRGYSGGDIIVIGRCNLKVLYKGQSYIIDFIIADVSSPPILGRYSCQELGVIKLTLAVTTNSQDEFTSGILNDYSDVFEGIGCMPGEYKICIDNTVRPVVHAPRKLPVAIKENLRNKLNEMEQQQIIAKVDGPTDWVNSMTVVRKPNGDLRICLDPQDLNLAIKREHFSLPTLEDITVKLSGAKYFSTVDAKNGFWQLKLSSDCTDLCTFNTAFGRYKFLRLPYGITSASEVFHKRMFEMFDDMEGVCHFIDDILIFAKTRQEHDRRLRAVLDRCRLINLKLNKNKCKFGLTEIKYLGHKFTQNGIYPDESHTSAIKEMKIPDNTKDLERFLGLVNYIGRFVPNLSNKTYELRQLLKKDVEWHWTDQHQNEFDSLKNILVDAPVLQYYVVDKPVVISVDASKNGLGACILQDNLPVSYASRSLTKAEQNYAQIEKELLACVYACEKFYCYIFGKNDVIIETDHKPLVNIIMKPISSAPARLQRMLLRLQLYSFKLVYKPGKYLYIADTLSRAPLPVSNQQLEERDHFDVQAQVCAVTACNPLTDTHFIILQKSTESDMELQLVIKYIKEGWPDNKQDVPDCVKPYWCFKSELSISYGLVWKDNRIVIPKALRHEMLKRVHVGHLGLEKCKLRTRETMFWPNINSQLEDYISKCQACLNFKNENRRETMISHEIPNRPWSKLGSDTFHFDGKLFLIVIDYYSKFFEVAELRSLKSEEIIQQLKIIFSKQGVPDILMTDNGPEYSSFEFRQFSEQWHFSHVTSSPRYPQSNGQSERTVQTVKNIMKKCRYESTDYRLALLEYLNTPISSSLASPSEILNSRKMRGLLPCIPKLLKPKLQTNITYELNKRQSMQKQYYDKGARDLAPLQVGQRVKVRVSKQWVDGSITSYVGKRSYSVQIDGGSRLIRNRRHLIINPNANRSNHDQPTLAYDDIVIQNSPPRPPINNNVVCQPYVSRFGREVRRPDRWGYSHT